MTPKKLTPEELKEWRERRHLSQADLAEKLGVHWTTINRWENKKREIPPFLHLALETVARNKRARNTSK